MIRRHLTGTIGLLFILLYCSSCSSTWKQNYHVRRANHHIRKAESFGAKWSSDTLFSKVKFKVPGIEVKFIPRPVVIGQPMIFEKDSVKATVTIKPSNKPNVPDTIRVECDCPDRELEATVPTAINKKLEPGKSNFYWYKWLAVVAVISFIGGYIYRGKNKVIVQVEKPATS
jgi:hypothetical protein